MFVLSLGFYAKLLKIILLCNKRVGNRAHLARGGGGGSGEAGEAGGADSKGAKAAVRRRDPVVDLGIYDLTLIINCNNNRHFACSYAAISRYWQAACIATGEGP